MPQMISSRPCRVVLVLQRMQLGHAVHADQLLVHLGRVLHGAGALADVARQVHAQRLLREAQVVAQHLVLAELRQRRRLGAPHALGHEGARVSDRLSTSGSA